MYLIQKRLRRDRNISREAKMRIYRAVKTSDVAICMTVNDEDKLWRLKGESQL